MGKAYGVRQVLYGSYRTLPFDGRWLDLVGTPAAGSSWIIWGHSYHGKSTLAYSLSKYLCRFGRVAYNSLEEGRGESLRRGFQRVDMQEVEGRLILLDREPMEEMSMRLFRRKSPSFVVIDSIQYSGLDYEGYKHLISQHRGKTFIWVSHAEGRHPEGKVASRVRYDADVKIHVRGFLANANSRYGGDGKPFVIWDAGAKKHYENEI